MNNKHTYLDYNYWNKHLPFDDGTTLVNMLTQEEINFLYKKYKIKTFEMSASETWENKTNKSGPRINGIKISFDETDDIFCMDYKKDQTLFDLDSNLSIFRVMMNEKNKILEDRFKEILSKLNITEEEIRFLKTYLDK